MCVLRVGAAADLLVRAGARCCHSRCYCCCCCCCCAAICLAAARSRCTDAHAHDWALTIQLHPSHRRYTDAYHVENALAADPSYVPGCNVAGFSCTKVFQSSYAHILSHFGVVEKASLFDLSLATSGFALYCGFFLYPILRKIPARHHILMFVSTSSICFSCFLLYVLKVILGEFCIVCTSFHTINFTMFFLCVSEWKYRQGVAAAKAARMV